MGKETISQGDIDAIMEHIKDKLLKYTYATPKIRIFFQCNYCSEPAIGSFPSTVMVDGDVKWFLPTGESINYCAEHEDDAKSDIKQVSPEGIKYTIFRGDD